MGNQRGFFNLAAFAKVFYGIKKVRRTDYVIYDRQQLQYLNFIEKFHCTYCAYGTGMIAYISEIVARTEQYFCPIKHARKILGAHSRYSHFIEYGDAENYQERLEQYRRALNKERALIKENEDISKITSIKRK
ncbi:MAG: hypothetical protein Q8J66_10285 [Methylotenera sp.]|nr:hypothetical protein [Methylotenera sp.]